jgi:NAD(P)-dependent dehydrogenase (short-subunit alcohol dehydrogenase family)
MKQYDLLQDINTRGTFALTRAALPWLEAADNPHVLTLSPPLEVEPRWFGHSLAYTMSKYGMSLCTLGFAGEFAAMGIAANSLWPRTTIATAAVRNLLGGEAAAHRARIPDIMADAAHAILTRDSRAGSLRRGLPAPLTAMRHPAAAQPPVAATAKLSASSASIAWAAPYSLGTRSRVRKSVTPPAASLGTSANMVA